MYLDFGPGQEIEFDAPSPNGVDLLFSEEYVAMQFKRGRLMLQQLTNNYGYVAGSPANFVDPFGRQAQGIWDPRQIFGPDSGLAPNITLRWYVPRDVPFQWQPAPSLDDLEKLHIPAEILPSTPGYLGPPGKIGDFEPCPIPDEDIFPTELQTGQHRALNKIPIGGRGGTLEINPFNRRTPFNIVIPLEPRQH